MTASLRTVRRLDELVRHWARETPEAVACTGGDVRISYADLGARIDRVARALLANGIRKGDRVATLAPASPDFLVCYLATASIGAIWIGLNPRYRLEELRHVLRDSQPAILFARTVIDGRRYASEIDALRAATPGLSLLVALDDAEDIDGLVSWQAFERDAERVVKGDLRRAHASVDPFDPCLIVYTSGSTGRPKGALLHHHAIAHFGIRQNELWPVSPMIAVNYFPINHVSAACDVTMPVLAAGGMLVFLEKFDAAAVLDLMQREGVTFWGSVPSAFQMQLERPDFADYDLSAVQLVAWGGAAMPEPIIRRLRDICPRLATNYGMTETMIATALAPTDDLDLLANTVGIAFPDVEIRLVNPDGSEPPAETAGEIWVRSDYNLIGYWRRPEASAEAFTSDGFFKTGDLATRRPDGKYRIVGRIKDMYKSGGYNVYPREIEMALEEHPLVHLAAVVSIADPQWQEIGIAYVIADPELRAAELEDHCRERLANYKIPKRFILQPGLPLLPNGKVDKVELKRRAGER